MSDINSPAYSAKYVAGLLDQLSASQAREAELHSCNHAQEVALENLSLEIVEYKQRAEATEAKIKASQERIKQFDQCIRVVAEALGSPACGGVDTDVYDPFGTAQVLITKINELKKRTIASSHS